MYGSGNWTAITDRAGLEAIKNDLTKTYVLMGNINLAGADWGAIGSEENQFSGTFDGNGFTISNLNINSTEIRQGLFGYTGSGSVLKNVHLEGGTVKGANAVGALVGCANGSIENCSSTVNVEGTGYYAGGLVGNARSSDITNSYATGDVTGNGSVGGLVGDASSSDITNSYATGEVTGSNDVGGLVGYASSSDITNSYATGDVTGNGSVGGLVGDAISSDITNSYATGDVSGNNRVGGLVGYASSNITTTNSYATGEVTGNDFVGGLVGHARSCETTNSYATGEVTGNGTVGGLVGLAEMNSTTTNSYATGDVSGNSRVGGLVGLAVSSETTNSFSTATVTRKDGATATTFGALYGESYGTSTNNYAAEQNFDFVGTTQDGVTEVSVDYFNDPANWESVLGSEYDYSTVPPILKSNPQPKPVTPSAGGGEAIRLQVGANFSEEDAIYVDSTFNMDGFSVDFSTTQSASQSLAQIDTLLNIITTKRTEMGAVSNRLDSIMSSQRTKIENYSSAKSTITDADIAKESSKLVSQQILQQASSALLLQTSETQRTIIGQLINGL